MPLHARRNRRVLSGTVISVALAAFLGSAVLAVGHDKAMYLRGTLSTIKARTEGRFDTQPQSELAFDAGKKGSVAIPYASIVSLAFEEKERVAVIIGLAPPVSKQLHSYLTITYNDPEGKAQSAVFELGKNIVRTVLRVVEARSGKGITFQGAATCRQYKTAEECEGE